MSCIDGSIQPGLQSDLGGRSSFTDGSAPPFMRLWPRLGAIAYLFRLSEMTSMTRGYILRRLQIL